MHFDNDNDSHSHSEDTYERINLSDNEDNVAAGQRHGSISSSSSSSSSSGVSSLDSGPRSTRLPPQRGAPSDGEDRDWMAYFAAPPTDVSDEEHDDEVRVAPSPPPHPHPSPPVAATQQQQQQQQHLGPRDSAGTLTNSTRSGGDDGSAAGKKDAAYEILQVPTDDEARRLGEGEPKWTPFYLRRTFLLAFAVVWVLMIVALELLYFFSERDGGLATVEQSLHYLWTYGPTFVLTMTAALWGQVEHSAKQIMPWSLMSRAQTAAEHSLLLNYLTASLPYALLRSVRRRHYPVSIGISGSLVLRLLIIFSTGLLGLEYHSVSRGGDFVVRDNFDLAKPVEYSFDQRGHMDRVLSNSANFWAILSYNLSYPHGATSRYALQSFAPVENGNYDNVTTDVLVLEAALENCDSFNFTYKTNGLDNFQTSLHSVTPEHYWHDWKQWCYVSHTTYSSSSTMADGILGKFTNLTEHIYKCTDSTPVEEQEDRILITLDSWLSSKQSELSGIMCQPKYSLTRRTVTNATNPTGNEDNVRVGAEVKETLDLGNRPFNITSQVLSGMDGESATGVVDIVANTWYTLLNTSQPQSSLQAFRNTSLVTELSQRMFPGIAAYTFKTDFMNELNRTVNGTVMFTETRLCVQELSLRLMEALLVLLVLFSIALCFLTPGVFHRDPRPLGAHALILARSPDLMRLLSGYGAASKRALKDRVSGCTAFFPQRRSPEEAAISVAPQDPIKSEMEPAEAGADEIDQRRWWHPMPSTWWFRGALIMAAIGVIVALEVLLQSSDKHDGLGDVTLDGYQKFAWTFIPTVVMATIGLAFSMADSTARTLYPFYMLRKGNASFKDMLYDPAGQVSLVAVARAAWKRHFALMAIMFTGLLAPVLTIVTSGLYTAAPVPSTHKVTPTMQDWFNMVNQTFNPNDLTMSVTGEAWTVFQLIEFSNMSYPQWTHEEYAFSSFSADNLGGYVNGKDHASTNTTTTATTPLSVRARLPAVRANINCSLLHTYTNANFSYNVDGTRDSYVVIDPPAGCHTPTYSSNDTARQLWLQPFTVSQNGLVGSDGPFFAHLSDSYADISFGWEGKFTSYRPDSTEICGDGGRRHTFYGAGRRTGEIFDELALLHCVPYAEALFVEGSFSLPDLALMSDGDTGQALTPDEDSAMLLSDRSSALAFASENFDHESSYEMLTAVIVNGSTHGVGALEAITGAYSNDSSSSRFDPRVDVDKLTRALAGSYAVYAAQNAHFNYRAPLAAFNDSNAMVNTTNAPGSTRRFSPSYFPSSSSSSGNQDDNNNNNNNDDDAIVTDATRLRLQQSATSTRILEGLLAAMVVCLIASALLEGWRGLGGFGGRRLLPKDPGSVAAKMALFADADAAWRREVPVGAERWGDEVVVRRGVFAGWAFGLGWWGGGAGGSGGEEGGEGEERRGRRYGVDGGLAPASAAPAGSRKEGRR